MEHNFNSRANSPSYMINSNFYYYLDPILLYPQHKEDSIINLIYRFKSHFYMMASELLNDNQHSQTFFVSLNLYRNLLFLFPISYNDVLKQNPTLGLSNSVPLGSS
jgi:hypothetical protein